MATDTNRTQGQAKALLEHIMEMVENLTREDIEKSPLSVAVRSGWVAPGTEKFEPQEFCILLCTGGPAVRVIGTMGTYRHGNEPDEVCLEYQDWDTPWIRYPLSSEERDVLTQYARCFYWGD